MNKFIVLTDEGDTLEIDAGTFSIDDEVAVFGVNHTATETEQVAAVFNPQHVFKKDSGRYVYGPHDIVTEKWAIARGRVGEVPCKNGLEEIEDIDDNPF